MNQKLLFALRAAAVGSHMIGEKLYPRPVRTRADVPRNGQELSTEWLTAVLCASIPGARVTSFDCVSGDSGTSTRAALRVTYNTAGRDAGLPAELFTKTTAKLSQRLLLGGADFLHGETAFFMTFRPKVEMEAPLGYWGNVDGSSWRSIIVMEDVAATKGAQFSTPITPIGREQVRDLLTNMASYHGTWWDAAELKQLSDPVRRLQNLCTFMDLPGRCAVGIQRADDVIPAALRGEADRIFSSTHVSLALLNDTTPTLLHGDCHVGQTYMTNDGRMGLADWQATLRGGWAFDLAYLIGSACEPADRVAWEKGLIADYLERLTACGVDAPSLSDAWMSYRQSMVYPFLAWAFTLGRAWYHPKMQSVPTCRAIIERLATAIDDLDSFDALGL